MPRTERDPLGEFPVPDDAWYGSQTARAVANFPISGLRMPAALVDATVRVKRAAARANAALGRLEKEVADAIDACAGDVLAGSYRDQFVVEPDRETRRDFREYGDGPYGSGEAGGRSSKLDG